MIRLRFGSRNVAIAWRTNFMIQATGSVAIYHILGLRVIVYRYYPYRRNSNIKVSDKRYPVFGKM